MESKPIDFKKPRVLVWTVFTAIAYALMLGLFIYGINKFTGSGSRVFVHEAFQDYPAVVLAILNYLIVYLVLSILFTFWLYQAGETLYKLSLSRGQSPVRLNKLLALVFVIVIFAGGVLLSQYILITTPMLIAVMFIIFAPIHFAIMIANYKRVIGQPKNIPGLWASWLLLPPLTVYMVQKDINSQIR